jgi:hypothetical protein
MEIRNDRETQANVDGIGQSGDGHNIRPGRDNKLNPPRKGIVNSAIDGMNALSAKMIESSIKIDAASSIFYGCAKSACALGGIAILGGAAVGTIISCMKDTAEAILDSYMQ